MVVCHCCHCHGELAAFFCSWRACCYHERETVREERNKNLRALAREKIKKEDEEKIPQWEEIEKICDFVRLKRGKKRGGKILCGGG